jgi:hypothetical protein
MRGKIYNEPIEIQKKRFGYFPQIFLWRGQRYDVRAVERCWTISRGRLRQRIQRLCFRVRCAEGTFDLYQDLGGNTWHLERVLTE